MLSIFKFLILIPFSIIIQKLYLHFSVSLHQSPDSALFRWKATVEELELLAHCSNYWSAYRTLST